MAYGLGLQIHRGKHRESTRSLFFNGEYLLQVKDEERMVKRDSLMFLIYTRYLN